MVHSPNACTWSFSDGIHGPNGALLVASLAARHGRVVSDCLTTDPDVRMKARDFRANCKKREVNDMNTAAVVVEGTVQPDGTLEVTQKVDLPAGPVHVTVQPVSRTGPAGSVLDDDGIHMGRSARQRAKPRTREEIDTEIEALRDESEEEMQAVERLQEECRRAREQARAAKEPPH